jgi:prephenate dehydratase
MGVNGKPLRVAFQGEPGAYSEEAAVRLLGKELQCEPRPTFEAAFQAVAKGAADVLVAPIENSLAGSVLRVYDLMLESDLAITAETILPIELHLIACPGATLASICSVESHPMALAQCERLFAAHPEWKRVAAEDTAGSVRAVVAAGDRSRAALAGRGAAARYGGVILSASVQDGSGNYTRFLLLAPRSAAASNGGDKVTLVVHVAHLPGALVAALEPFARHGVNLLKIESRPIHGCPWEYQFFLDVEASPSGLMEDALADVRARAQSVRVLGRYPAAWTRLEMPRAVLGRSA